MAAPMTFTVHESKYYGPNEIRHFQAKGFLSVSTSGQFSRENFPTLIEKIKNLKNQILNNEIVFIDTRQDTHLELNKLVVSIESDNNSGKKWNEIVDREKALSQDLINKTVEWIRKEEPLFGKKIEVSSQKQITEGETTQKFIKEFGAIYHRVPINEHGPLEDDQLEWFLQTIDSEAKWFHFNSKVGVGTSVQLLVIMDIYKNATTKTLEEILQRNDPKEHLSKNPKAYDENRDKKLARREFIKQFYDYCKTKKEHDLTWPDWKKKQSKEPQEVFIQI